MSPVDDIIINKQMPQKKKGKGILVALFLLLIILAGLCGAYWYVNMRETPKVLFFKYIGQTNIPEIIDTEIYYNILEKMNSESYETSTTANFTTTKETEFSQNVDVSKFEFTLDTASDKVNESAQINADIKYSSNDFFDLKFVSTKDSMAIGSNEILDKYIATSKTELANSINKTTGSETEITSEVVNEKMDELSENRIDLDEVFASEKANEYMSVLLEKIPEEAVTVSEGTQVTINSNLINTNAYTLNLDVNLYSNLTTEILTKLKNDTDFLSKIVTENSLEEIEENIEVEKDAQETKPLTIERIEGQTEEHQTSQEISDELEVITGPDTGALLTSEEENLEVITEPDTGDLLKIDELEVVKEPDIGPLLKDEVEDSILLQIISALFLNQKLDMTTSELQNKIEEEIANLNITEGLKVTVYVKDVEGEENQTIKLVAELPENASLDIEYPESTKVKITFLEDVEQENELGEVVTKNIGSAIELKRTNTNMQTNFDITLNSIEEKKVVGKLQIELETKGASTSRNYSNNAIVKYNDSEGDIKINIKNNINFKDTEIIENLNDENAIFIDKLTEEEASELFKTVVLKLMQVYSEKVLNMNFIDNNSSSSVIEQPNTENYAEPEIIPEQEQQEDDSNVSALEITKATAKDLLVKKVEEMMINAQNNGEEFTIQSLNNLPEQIDGHNVSSIITEEQATVKIAGYTFYIDKDFMLTEE